MPVVAAAVVVPAVVVAVIVGVVGGLLGVSPALSAALAAAAAVALALWLRLTAARYSLRALGSSPIDIGDMPRLENLVQGLCTTHGFQMPEVHAVEADAVNAASVSSGSRRDHLVLTRGALVGLDRLELEAVVARQLCQIRGEADTATFLASVARLPVARMLALRLLERVLDRQSSIELDLEAVKLTGYPPALASAIKKSVDAPSVAGASATSHLWMVIPSDTGSGNRLQPTAVERMDVLCEV